MFNRKLKEEMRLTRALIYKIAEKVSELEAKLCFIEGENKRSARK